MKRGKALYDALPIWAQTVAVNVASGYNWRDRYGVVFHEALQTLEANERKSRDQLLTEQQEALRSLLRYAVQHVPFYRDQKLPVDDYAAWPLLEKRTVVAQPEKFLSDEFAMRRLLTVQTSGTTGTPLTMRLTSACQQLEMAFRWRHRAWGGTPFLSRSAYLSGHPVVPATQTRPPFWRADRVERRLLCSSYHFTPQNVPEYLQALIDYAPDFVHGYPSSLYVLAQHPQAREVRPRAVFAASETLLDFQRAAIEDAFGAKVFNWYGNTEMTGNIVECAFGELHYRTDYGFLELLPTGEIVATGFNNRAMPLIRYRTGDTASARAGTCGCGCEFPLMERVEGRVEDYVRTPDGRLVGRLDHIFKGVAHVREAQLVQREPTELRLRIVRMNDFTPQDEQAILANARDRLGPAIRLQCEYVDAIPRTSTGKFRFVVTGDN